MLGETKVLPFTMAVLGPSPVAVAGTVLPFCRQRSPLVVVTGQ